MASKLARWFDRAFKVAAVERMAAGANVSALSRELGVRRKLLHQWRDTVRRGGVEALRGVGRPPAGEGLTAAGERGPVVAPDERARARIAALERKIGRQALEPDFFGQALQLMEQVGRAASVPSDAPASTTSSGPLRGLLAAALAGIG